MNNIVLDVKGMSCGHCAAAVKTAVLALEGIESVEIDLQSEKVCISYNNITIEDIKSVIEEQGYDVV